MPGYHELAEGEDEDSFAMDDLVLDANADHTMPGQDFTMQNVTGNRVFEQRRSGNAQQRSRPPKSAPAPATPSVASSSRTKPMSSGSRNPTSSLRSSAATSGHDIPNVPTTPSSHSPAERSPPVRDGSEEMQTCPICGKSMRTDNQGLNAHIDFCLSKEAIRDAQSSASVSTFTKASSTKVKGNTGPASKKGGAKINVKGNKR